MHFYKDISGIDVYLKIKGYSTSTKDDWDCKWCKCDFMFKSGKWLNYHKEDDEVLLSSEVEDLKEYLTKLLNGELSEVYEFECMEPDFIFTLYPEKDLRDDQKYVYVQPGFEIEDIHMEWKIYFWSDGLTDNFLTVTLDRSDIVEFRDYLTSIISKN
jgi:hypothetical protein